MRPHRRGYPAASDTDVTKEVAYCKKEVLTRRYIGTSGQHKSAAESMSVPDRPERRGSGLLRLEDAPFGVPIQRRGQHNVVVSAGLVVHF